MGCLSHAFSGFYTNSKQAANMHDRIQCFPISRRQSMPLRHTQNKVALATHIAVLHNTEAKQQTPLP